MAESLLWAPQVGFCLSRDGQALLFWPIVPKGKTLIFGPDRPGRHPSAAGLWDHSRVSYPLPTMQCPSRAVARRLKDKEDMFVWQICRWLKGFEVGNPRAEGHRRLLLMMVELSLGTLMSGKGRYLIWCPLEAMGLLLCPSLLEAIGCSSRRRSLQ